MIFVCVKVGQTLIKAIKVVFTLSNFDQVNFLILSVDSDWLISIKVGQILTGNRNDFCLRQSWSNFDQVHQSGVYTVKL